MTVSELIEKLSSLPPDAAVVIDMMGGEGEAGFRCDVSFPVFSPIDNTVRL